MQSYQKIAAWAATVQPGSPAPPSIFSPCSLSFLNLTPSPTTLVDLTTLGYTTIFVQFPKTPLTASPYLCPRQPNEQSKNMAPQQQQRSTSSAFGRLRSLANIGNRSRSKSVSAGAGATSPKPKPTQSKKAKHAHVPPPSPLANELALMQFMEGGSIESHAKRVVKAQARAAAGSHYDPQNVSFGALYRDDKGNMWWDEDEQYEYAHLLAGESVDMYAYQGNEGTDAWVRFGKQSPSGKDSPARRHQQKQPRTPPSDLERRESLSTQESDFMNIVNPVEEDTVPITVPGLSLLSIPMRARKQALRKPEFLVDVAAFGPRSPSGVSTSFDPITSDAARLKGKARRRPAPLKIPSPASTSKRPSNPALPSAGLPLAERVQREFFENSFKPMPRPRRQPVTHQEVPKAATTTGMMKNLGWRLRAGTAAVTSTSSSVMRKKPSRVDIRTVFGTGVRNE